MVAVRAEQRTEDGILDLGRAYVQAELDAGADLRPAAEAALRRFIAEGRGIELLEAIGGAALMAAWRHGARLERASAYLAATEEPVVLVPLSPVPASADGERIERAAPARSSMYALRVHAGGKWYVLGEMTQGDCREAFLFHRALANGNAREARWYKRLEAGLKGATTVKERYSEDELKQIRREVEEVK